MNFFKFAALTVFATSVSLVSLPVQACDVGDGCGKPSDMGNNGWGNGDDNAPGNSESNNGAENNPGNGNNMDNAPGKSGDH